MYRHQDICIQQLNVGEVNTGGMLIPLQGFFFGKGVPLPQLLLTYKGDSDTDLFKIHHSAFQTDLLKINF